MPKAPQGMIINQDGYLRIKARRNGNRDQLAHRVYAARQMGLKRLPGHLEVHHICGNRACWPPSDYHIAIVDERLAPYMYQTHANRANRRNKRKWY